FDWVALKPTQHLEWHECYAPPPAADTIQKILSSPSNSRSRTFACARLSLPLDYHNSTNPHNVSVPILRVSSTPSSSHNGTIIAAFGGAGNSRIQDLVTLTSGGFLDEIDPDFEYDFVTFDNRGFGYSSPSAKCFDHVLDGVLFEERMIDLGGVMSTRDGDDQIEVRLAAAKAKGELCSGRNEEDADIRRHMSTAYAARDMLEILKRLPGSPSKSADTYGEHPTNNEIQKLKFIGLSYGTMVGQFFASLYPEYVSRMVLDGTGDARDWVAKWQMGHLIDTDTVWASFVDDCFEAKESCPLWTKSDSKSADIESRIVEFVESLKQRPLYSVVDGSARLITYRDAKLAMYWTTMAPGFAAPVMATILDEFMKGRTNVTIDFPFEGIPTAASALDMESPDKMAASNADAGIAVNCADAEEIINVSLPSFKEYLSALENQSSVAAFFQGERKIRCMGWPIRPAWRFTGPFTSRSENGSSKLPNPILFMGNRLDPMTSLVNARKVANDFPGSVVLEQNARGHCALGNAVPSPCTLRYLRSYLKDGTLPEHGTVCGDDC
ncbi:alpha/beta-hydrolase, partial [Stipitochalara longipes BDJ]